MALKEVFTSKRELPFATRQPKKKQQAILQRIYHHWISNRKQSLTLANSIPVSLDMQPSKQELTMKFLIYGIECETANKLHVAFKKNNQVCVYISTYQPSYLLQTLWNVVIRYSCSSKKLEMIYEKTISSSALPILNQLILNWSYEQQKKDTEIVADAEIATIRDLIAKN